MKFGLSPKACANLIGATVIILLIWSIFTPGEGFKRTAEQQDYTNVVIGGFSLFGCPEKEFGFNFEGVKNGKPIKGVICRTFPFFGSYNIRQY